MLGISGAEFFVILLVIAIVVGPQRLPEYTRKLTQAVRRLRVFLDDAKTQIAEEVGPELGELDLSDLDPRNYDPRKIVRDALGEDLDAIRKDLTNPFQSVMETAKEASDEAAAAVSGKGQKKSKSLSKMIEDKAEETRSARTASTGAAAAATVAAAAATGDQQGADGSEQADKQADKNPEQAAQEAAAVTAELPQVEPVAAVAEDEDSAAEQDDVDEPSATELTAAQSAADAGDATAEGIEEVGDASADAAQIALEAGDTATAEIPEVQPTADVEEVAAGIPSTLAEEPQQDETVQALRPVSPRDIVRAANEAARTRAEAATAAVA
ncbi:MAG: twin-arginine translocase TatA/TatE family subunit [Actinomyces succiniciruminis]|nr:twin-arginine translocase TatA/TatE family subunit [Actinomyces succiniciruminis]